jgi:hypothetical protein
VREDGDVWIQIMTIHDLRRVLAPTLLVFSLSDASGLIGTGGSHPSGSVDDRVPIAFVPLSRARGRQDIVRRVQHPQRPVDVRGRPVL